VTLPHRFNWIDPQSNRFLAIAPRPRGGDLLAEEIAAWKSDGAAVVVSLLDATETHELDLADEAAQCRAAGVEFFSFPISDRGVPESIAAAEALARQILSRLDHGRRVVVHCRVGIGRSALIAAAVLVCAGMTAENAFAAIGRSRGTAVPDTDEQRAWVEKFADFVITR
jgi:protein-tyrosine phosphatase